MAIKPLKIGDLSIPIPIIQGGMGIGVSKSRLAAAVANAGGVGVISGAQIGWQEDDFDKNPLRANCRALRSEIKKAKAAAPTGIIGLNLMVAMQNYAEFVKVAVEEKVDMIISGAGIPLDLPGFVRGSNVKIVPIVSSLRGAKLILKRWQKKYERTPDAIVVEGAKAGGHLGFKPEEFMDDSYKRLKDIVKELTMHLKNLHLDIPVIAAGGIYNQADVKAVLNAGAQGVQVGTRFVVTEECDASDAFKQAYVDATEADIKIMMSPVGLPGRALNNAFLKKADAAGRIKVEKCWRCVHKCNPADTPFCITKALIDAVDGRTEEGLMFVGAGAYKMNRITTVQEVMEDLGPAFND